MRLDLLSVARDWAARPGRWTVQPQFDLVERWYARIARAADHEVWLLTWLPGQETDWHDHGGSAGAFVVISGTLVERTVSGGRVAHTTLRAGAGRRFGAHHVHSVANRGAEPAISIHAYSPALLSMTRYRLDGGKLRVAEIEKAGVAW